MNIKHSWLLYALAFIMGVCGMGFEYTFSKISSDLMGQTTLQWALIIGLMMLAMGLGADFQKKITDHYLFEKFILLEILLSWLGGFGAVFLVYSFGEFRNYFTLIQYGVSFSVGFLIGMEIPLLVRLNEPDLLLSSSTSEKSKKPIKPIKYNLAQIFRMDYFGSFVGAFLWALVMIRINDSILEVAFLLSSINLTGVLVVVFFKRNLSKFFFPLTVFLIINLSFQGLGFLSVKKWTPALEQKLFREKIIHSETSPYQHIVLTEGKNKKISLYLNGNLQFSQSDEKIYHEWLVHPVLLMSPKPRKVLILGGGDGLALREVLRYTSKEKFPVSKVSLVELDQAIINLARNHPALKKLNENSLNNPLVSIVPTSQIFSSTPNKTRNVIIPDRSHFPITFPNTNQLSVKVIKFDATQWIESINERFDVIILDFPDPSQPELSQLYSLSFYRQLYHILRPNGLLVQQASSPFYVKETFLLIGRTLRQAGFETLPYQGMVPSFGPWGWWLAGKFPEKVSKKSDKKAKMIVSTKLKKRWEIVSSPQKLEKVWPLSLHYLTPELMKTGTVFSKNNLQTEIGKEKNQYNTKLNYLAYRFYTKETQSLWW